MTIAVVLLTCGRLDYTRRTLETFAAQNPDARERFVLLHADDASDDPELLSTAAAHGFELVVAHQARRGVRVLRAEAIAAAAARGADWVLVLENDWEWARPFPWALFDYLRTARPDVYCLRLYGQYKERGRRCACWSVDVGRGRRPVTWEADAAAPERIDVTHIHWGAPPAVTRMAEARQLCVLPAGDGYDGSGDTHEMAASGAIAALVARVVDNVVFHIGHDRTAAPDKIQRTEAPQVYDAAWQKTRRWTSDGSTRCFDLALKAFGEPRSLLDVGCGDGHLVTRAQARGIDAVGVDVSLTTRDGALRQADLREPLDLGRTFETVLCWEVAEHLPAASADTLCDTLVRHLGPGGRLLFTAAHPGQRGDGHINEQLTTYWRARLVARGLRFQETETQLLAAQWSYTAKQTPWYGANLQVFRAPGAVTRPAAAPLTLPRVALTMRTADRSPHPNYLGGTVRRMVAQGIPAADIHVCATDPNTAWLERELDGVPVTLHVPARRLTPNENGLAQIRVIDPASCDWMLLLEDDLAFCADFLGSVQRWLARVARADRHVYRFFGFRIRVPRARSLAAYDWSLKGLCGSQAVALRTEEALDFLAWADANLETWGGFRGNAKIAFDKLIASWALARWPGTPGVMSHPLFVQHVGDVSSIHPRAARNDGLFAGAHWSYQGYGAQA